MKPTTEQTYNTSLIADGKNVIITAGAGCGKSTSLRYAANSIPDKNFLVLTFNKANAEETREHADRPSNLFASTVHSLAYREVMNGVLKGKKIANYLDYKNIPSEEIDTLIEQEGLLHDVNDARKYQYAFKAYIADSIRNFCISSNKYITESIGNYLTYRLITEREEQSLTPYSQK